MLKRSLFIMTALVFTLAWPLSAEDTLYSGGEGTDSAPYLISTVEDWTFLSNSPHHWTAHFRLKNDINFYNENVSPVGTAVGKDAFTGSFDGQGHSLKNINIKSSNKFGTGLFGVVGEGGSIENLSLSGFNVVGQDNVGTLVGSINKGSVKKCSADGNVTGRMNVGGLIGKQELSSISHCDSKGNVFGSSSAAGGLIGLSGGSGWASGGSISNSKSSSTVEGSRVVGGFIGSLQDGTVENCSASGKVQGSSHAGGFAGSIQSSVTTSFATGEINNSGNFTGGFVGFNTGSISECYATGAANGERHTGGFAGSTSGVIQDCYSWGNAKSAQGYAGALVGRMEKATIKHCYALGKPKGNIHSKGLAGRGETKDIQASYYQSDDEDDPLARSQEDMTPPYSENTYEEWDFEEVWAEAKDEHSNKGYPWLKKIAP